MTHGSARFRRNGRTPSLPILKISVGGDRALCRLTDLLELALFMARLTSKRRTADPALCKDNSAAFVKANNAAESMGHSD